MREYIHPYKHNLEKEIQRVKDSKMLASNKQLILKFYKHNMAQELSLPRMERQTSVLRKVAEWQKKVFTGLCCPK